MDDRNPVESQLIPVYRDTASGLRLVKSVDLVQDGHELLIQHDGQLYHLRVTRSGKLILTK